MRLTERIRKLIPYTWSGIPEGARCLHIVTVQVLKVLPRCPSSCPVAVAVGCLVHHRHSFPLSLSDRSEGSDAASRRYSATGVIDTAEEYNYKRTVRYAQPPPTHTHTPSATVVSEIIDTFTDSHVVSIDIPPISKCITDFDYILLLLFWLAGRNLCRKSSFPVSGKLTKSFQVRRIVLLCPFVVINRTNALMRSPSLPAPKIFGLDTHIHWSGTSWLGTLCYDCCLQQE